LYKVTKMKMSPKEALTLGQRRLNEAVQAESEGLALIEAANGSGDDYIIYFDDEGAECICLDSKTAYEYNPNTDYLITRAANS